MKITSALSALVVAMGLSATTVQAENPDGGKKGAKRPGQTIFADDKRATLKAMRAVAKSLGVKCTYCHVKKGGKVRYKIETPHKETGRRMKLELVDELLEKGESRVEYPHDGGTAMVRARVETRGEAAGIYLQKIESGEVVAEKRVDLPGKGEALHCRTCHGGHTHIFAHADGED